MIKPLFSGLLLVLVLLWSCDQSNEPKPEGNNQYFGTDIPTTGEIDMEADIQYQPILTQLEDVFEATYTHATLNISYSGEEDVIQHLLEKKPRMVMTGRDLTTVEDSFLIQQQIWPKVYLVAWDAVVLIAHPENPINRLSRKQLKDLLSGNIHTWADLGSADTDTVRWIVDHPGSGAVGHLQRNVLGSAVWAAPVYSADSFAGVIQMVRARKDAIGVLGLSWMSDLDDPQTRAVRDSVQLISVEEADSNGIPTGNYFLPYQTEIFLGQYSLRRAVYFLSRETHNGLGTGFASYTLSEKGQRILLKAGLVPAILPPRTIQFTNERLHLQP